MQISRFGFLALLWWFIFRALASIRSDVIKNTSTLTKSRLSPATPNQRLTTQISTQASTPAKSYITPQTSKLIPPARGYSTPKTHYLIITAGPSAGDKLILESDCIFIGRSSDCTLQVHDEFISPLHAKLSKSGEQWYLEDLGSTNGTFLAKSRISSSVLVPLFTPIRVGKTIFELQS